MGDREHGVRWASRAEFGEGADALAEAISAARANGHALLDLTVTNPTRCGLTYDTALILGGLASPEGLQYDAHPLGMRIAREAIARQYYAPHGVSVDADRMVLTASTSEAYGYLLRLLCDAGDDVLIPQPSYPLFDLLARLHDVCLRTYPLLRHDGWRIDTGALRAAIGQRTRAIVLVHPNNPTGHAVAADERERVQAIAVEFGLALLVDEVFFDFPIELREPMRSFAEGPAPVLTFVMSGLSKVLALPQMKLAWTVVRGPEAAEAMGRLEFIADTFLSPNAPVQRAVGTWLAGSSAIQAQIVDRVRQNLRTLDRVLGGQTLCSRLPVQAGWCVVLRVPATEADDVLALRLLDWHGLVVHPGSFYGLPARGWLVLSLLSVAEVFAEGIDRLVRGVAEVVSEVSAVPSM